MFRAKQYLLEQAVRHYVENVDQVLKQLSISALMFGSLRLDVVNLVPETMQDTLFAYVFYGSEIVRMVAFDVQVKLDLLAVSTKSIQIHAKSLEVDLVLQDFTKPEDKREFWAAQAMRMKARAEAMGEPADTTLSYKVLGGLDIQADIVSARITMPNETVPRLLATLTGLHYGPCTDSGVPTLDLDKAIRPNAEFCEIAYGYFLGIKTILFALLPRGGEAWAGKSHAVIELIGLELASHGRVAAVKRRESPFYSTGVTVIDLREVRAPGPLPLDVGAGIIDVLSYAAASDGLRDPEGGQPGGNSDHRDDDVASASASAEPREASAFEWGEEAGEQSPTPVGETSRNGSVSPFIEIDAPPEEEVRRQAEQRLLAARQTTRDMAVLLEDARRTASDRASPVARTRNPKEPVAAMEEVPPLPFSEGSSSPQEPTLEGADAERAHAAAIGDGDDDNFEDCEEFSVLELASADDASASVDPRERLEQGVLKRSAFTLHSVGLEVVGKQGSVRLEVGELRLSSDSRTQLNSWEKKCFTSLFDLPGTVVVACSEALPSSQGDVASSSEAESKPPSSASAPPFALLRGREPGTIYAGVSLASAHLTFAPPGGAAMDVFHLRRGLQLRHRGSADPARLGLAEPLKLLEVVVADVRIWDRGREEVVAMAQTLADAVVPSPPTASRQEDDLDSASPQGKVQASSTCYSLEAVNVSLEAFYDGQALQCTLPCVRVRSVLNSFDEIWSLALFDSSLIRGMSEPLWDGDSAARPYLETDASKSASSSVGEEIDGRPLALREDLQATSCGGSSANEVIANLQHAVERERSARETESRKVAELEARLEQVLEVLRMVNGSPGGPSTWMLQYLANAQGRANQTRRSNGPAAITSGSANGAVATGMDVENGKVQAIVPVTSPTPAKKDSAQKDGVGQQLGIETLMFQLDAGQKIWHQVEGLRRGDSLGWAIEELQAMTLDITVIVRSRCKIHAARRFRDTMRIATDNGPFRDCLRVSDEYDDSQLPLTVDIQLSNAFSWWNGKQIRLTLWRLKAE